MQLKPISLVLGLLLFCFSCKKPKEGVYKIAFTDNAGHQHDYTIVTTRNSNEVVVSGGGSTHDNFSGKLNLYKGKTDGIIKRTYTGLATSSASTYNMMGTYSRKEISGTYTEEGSAWSPSGGSSISTSSGTFVISWQSKD